MKLKGLASKKENEALNAIKEMIAQYRLVPGQKVTYIQLAEKLKMSQTPIIAALSRLEQEGFFVLIPNKGFFIKEIDTKELTNLFKIRQALEILAVEESVGKVNTKLLNKVEKAMIAHRDYHSNVVTKRRLALDAIFHLKIAAINQNQILIELLKNILERIYLRYQSELVDPVRLIQAAEEHRNIFNAIKKGDVAKGEIYMRQHLQAAEIAVSKGIKEAAKTYRF